MRKLMIIILIIFALVLACIYYFIPPKIKFSNIIIINTKAGIASRFLMNESKWSKWFPVLPENKLSDFPGDKDYHYKKHFYSIEKKMMNTAEIAISNNEMFLNSLISIISVNSDSVAIEWKGIVPGSSNPFGRVKKYIYAKKLHNDMGYILENLKGFLEKKENVYGLNFHVIISKDTTLIATKCLTRTYPSTHNIYSLITNLKEYISGEGAHENNFPMLNVKRVNDSTFETMVAIPINKQLKGNNKIFSKRFVPWKVLTAEVKGGDYSVNEALKEMEVYLTDYQIPAMAIPFASLETDRSQQPDTLKWITGIYTPIP